MKNLAPKIFRKRLVIEGVPDHSISPEEIKEYLCKLSRLLKMKILLNPMTHWSSKYGWAGWIHWSASGTHFYAWNNPLFFSVDIYTCKRFNVKTAVAFTKQFFRAKKIVFKTI